MRTYRNALLGTAIAIVLATVASNAGDAQTTKKTPPPPPPARVPVPQKVPPPPPQRVPPPPTQPRTPQPTQPQPATRTPPPTVPPRTPVPTSQPHVAPVPTPPAPARTPPAPKPAVVNAQTGKAALPAGTKVVAKTPNGQVFETPSHQKVQVNAAGNVTKIQSAHGTEGAVNHGRITTVKHVNPDGTGVITHTSPTNVRTIDYTTKGKNGEPVHVMVHGNRISQEHPIPGRRGFTQRTTEFNGRTRVTVYRSVHYGRYDYPVYVHDYYYGPGAYVYFGSPWVHPVIFGWGFYAGYGAYGTYFAPAITYNSPDEWSADYIMAENLRANQDAQETASTDGSEPPTGNITPITPQIRQDYVRQVSMQRQLDAAAAAGQTPADTTPGALNPKFSLFQSYSDVEADNGGEQCAITGGDFVRRADLTPDASGTVSVTVASVAKATTSHCTVGSTVRVPVATLQEWFNRFVEDQQKSYEEMVKGDMHDKFPPVPDATPVPNPSGVATPDSPQAIADTSREAQTNASQAESEIQTGGNS